MTFSKMFSSFVLVLATLATASAQGQTLVNFGPATSCPSYCTGFTTDNAAVSVDYINPYNYGNLAIQVNGVRYTGNVTYSVTEVISATYPTMQILQSDDVNAYAPDGSFVVVKVKVRKTTRKINNGRAHYYLTKYFVESGTVTLP